MKYLMLVSKCEMRINRLPFFYGVFRLFAITGRITV